jgi:hypothetical protein
LTRANEARLAQKRQSEALAAVTAEYRRLSPHATGDTLAISGEVNRMIAAAINADHPRVSARPGCVTSGHRVQFSADDAQAGYAVRRRNTAARLARAARLFAMRQPRNRYGRDRGGEAIDESAGNLM